MEDDVVYVRDHRVTDRDVAELFLKHLDYNYRFGWTELDREMAEHNFRQIIRVLGKQMYAIYGNACNDCDNDWDLYHANIFFDVEDYIDYKKEYLDEI